MAGERRDGANEDYPLSEVPLSDRRGLLPTTVILLGFTFFSATMWGGGAIGVAFPLWPDLFAVIACGNLLLALYVAALAYVSQKSGLNTVLMGRFAFGTIGGRWVDLLLGITQVGWYAWGTATIAILFSTLLHLDAGWQAPLMLIFGFTFCWTAFIGYRGLERLSTVSVPLMCLLILVSAAVATRDAGGIGGVLSIAPTATMGFGEAVTVVVGTFIAGGTQATNWTRFSDTAKNAVIAALVAFCAGNGLMVFIGAYGAAVYGEPDIVEVLALLGMYAWLVPYMMALGTLVPPIGGVIAADFFLKHRGAYPPLERADACAFNAPGIAAYIGASAVAAFTPGIPPVNGTVAAVLFYLAGDRLSRRP